jgi:ubiquinone/menaquinone biosynthesis C-methylase UbiE
MTTLPFLVEPGTLAPLHSAADASGAPVLRTSGGVSYSVVRNVPVFVNFDTEGASEPDDVQHRAAEFEQMYRSLKEPWKYSGRMAEVLRHEFVATLAPEICPEASWVLDLGCSVGQLSALLGKSFPRIASLDVSATAVWKAQEYCKTVTNGGKATEFAFVVGSATELPFAAESFSLVVASDGLFGWELSEAAQRQVVSEILRVLKPGGAAIFTDYLGHKKFDRLLRLIDESPLHRERVEYLHDRLWYQMESWFHLVQESVVAKAVLRNRPLALGLRRVAELWGAQASKHICVVARKQA